MLVPNLIHSVFKPAEWGSHWAAVWLALVLVSYDLPRSCYYACWIGQSLGCYLVGNLSPNCHLSNLYQTFNVTVKPRAAVSLASRLVLTIFFLLIVLQLSNDLSLSSFHASFASFYGTSATVVWLVADFLTPHFLIF